MLKIVHKRAEFGTQKYRNFVVEEGFIRRSEAELAAAFLNNQKQLFLYLNKRVMSCKSKTIPRPA